MKKIIYICVLLMALTIFPGCKDTFFDLEAPPVTGWKTVDDLELGINTPYNNSFLRITGSGFNVTTPFYRLNTIHAAMSDMTRLIAENSGFQMQMVYDRKTELNYLGAQSTYAQSYLIISECNYILDFLDKDPFPNATEKDMVNIKRVKGEALFLRAFAYFNLSALFAPIYDPQGANDGKYLVLRTTFPTDAVSAQSNTPHSVKEIWEQMKKDFTEAADLLPLKWTAGMPESYKFGRATKHAALAMLAKVQCHMGNYDDALTTLNSILSDSNLARTLENNPLAVFSNNSYLTPWNSPEIIWYSQHASPNKMATARHEYMDPYFFNKTFPNPADYRAWWTLTLDTKTAERCNMMVNGIVTNEWENDKRRQLWWYWKGADAAAAKKNLVYIENPDCVGRVGKEDPLLMVDKYYRAPLAANASKEPVQNLPLIRVAEMYILRAAVKLQKSDDAGAATDLNVVRQRAWDTSKSGNFVPLATATWGDVDKEWIRELSFEQSHILFLQMFRKPIGSAGRVGVADILPPYDKLFWPVPVAETDFIK